MNTSEGKTRDIDYWDPMVTNEERLRTPQRVKCADPRNIGTDPQRFRTPQKGRCVDPGLRTPQISKQKILVMCNQGLRTPQRVRRVDPEVRGQDTRYWLWDPRVTNTSED